MQAIVSDLDGMAVDTQPGKMASWAIALLYQIGGISQSDFHKLTDGDETTARRLNSWLYAEHSSLVAFIRSIDGLSQDETLRRIWEESHPSGSKEELRTRRNAIRNTLITALAEPITGTTEFLRSARGKLRIGLVTQTDDETVTLLEEGGVLPKGLFETVVACGSDARLRAISLSLPKKKAAFLFACKDLGVSPAETLAIEDSPEGLRAARQAGLVCLGLARPGTPHDLSEYADIVVVDLGANARPEVIDMLADAPPTEVIALLKAVMR